MGRQEPASAGSAALLCGKRTMQKHRQAMNGGLLQGAYGSVPAQYPTRHHSL